MKQTHYYTNEKEALLHLDNLRKKYKYVGMISLWFGEEGLYEFIIDE